VWHYNNTPSENTPSTGQGNSLYSGAVDLSTTNASNLFYQLIDQQRGGAKVVEMNNQTTGDGEVFADGDNQWGDGTTGDRQSAAVDVHFAIARTWDYYWNVHGRWGMDGQGGEITSKVHYDSNLENARHIGGNTLVFGDGKAGNTTPWVSVDVVGHEFTH